MSGRRSHTRFAVASPWTGAVRMLRDVVVGRTGRDELLAITHSAAVVGEELSLDLIGGGQALAVRVRVLESRPIIVDGTVRHRVRLALPASAVSEAESAAPQGGSPEDPAQAPGALGMLRLGGAGAA